MNVIPLPHGGPSPSVLPLIIQKNIVFETIREEEFAPVKNAAGIDSVETCRELMVNLNKKWLTKRGITIPGAVKIIEIDPMLAVEEEDLPTAMTLPGEEKIYLK